MSVGKQSTLKVRGKTLQKVDAMIADQTATVVLSLFYGRIILHYLRTRHMLSKM